uniref:Leucine-rich repeat-containing protein 1 n=1 Tax=Globodera pallida TaxID=36090 RepID=A0A183BVP4_GLOPA
MARNNKILSHRLQKLQRLGLSDNDIHRLPAEVAALQNLMELNLSRNDISDLPEDLKICHNLQPEFPSTECPSTEVG